MKLPNFDKFIPSSEKSFSTWAIALTAVSFFSINIISNSELKNARIDLTEDQLYTITEGTKKVLSSIDEPIAYSDASGHLNRSIRPLYVRHYEAFILIIIFGCFGHRNSDFFF